MTDHATATATTTVPEPTDFGDGEFAMALVNVTDVCDLDCSHRFVFRAGNPNLIKANIGALEMMFSDVCLEHTGDTGEHCLMKATLPLYVGKGGEFERIFCCYGNDVDYTKYGAYSVFSSA